jgi:ABC-type multidrug transport system fused ATPase/permease subunit
MRMGLASIIMYTTSITGALIIIFFLDARLATIAVAILPFAIVFAWFIGKYSRTAHRNALALLASLTARIQENFSGMKGDKIIL